MANLVEFHGHLTRGDGGPMPAGSRDLRFDLYPTPTGGASLWSEVIADATVGLDGECHVVLGRTAPLTADLFTEGPRWLAVHEVLPGAAGLELGPRVPVSGQVLLLASALVDLEVRVARMESGGPHLAPPDTRQQRRLRLLHRRLRRIEAGKGVLEPVAEGLDQLRMRLAQLDADDGRLGRLEDELEDLVGPDGDLIDLLERVEKLEGSGPVPRPAPPPATLARMDPRFVAQLAERVEATSQRLAALEVREPPAVTAESLHAVKRSGDVMTGGLTINRGGLEVVSGGIKSRGADVNTLEASIHVKTPRLITDGIELRGDLTVDNTRRVLQVRHLEGRAGSGRKDGALLLNARSGEEVEVGNADHHAGMRVHGAVVADGLSTPAGALAARFEGEGVEPGDVCGIGPRGGVGRAVEGGAVIGVCVAAAAMASGEGPLLVAWGGVARCRVTGDVSPGDLLVASASPGRARAADGPPTPGTLLGRALTAAKGESGEVSVLLSLG